MNIVIVNCFDTWEHRADLLYKVITQAGYKVKVLTSDYCHIHKKRRSGYKKDYKYFQAQTYEKNISAARLYSHIQLSMDIFRYVQRHVRKIDLLWVFAPPNIFVCHAAQIKKYFPKMRLVIDLIDLWPESFPFDKMKQNPFFYAWKKMRDEGLRYADIVVTECDLYQNMLGKELTGIKTETLYLAREDRGYHSGIHLEDDKMVLCYLGSISNIIDINVIREIIKKCTRKMPVEFHIIGDGEKKKELIRAAEDAGADVVYHGKVYNWKEKQKIFDICHYGLNIMKESVCVGLTMKSIDYFESGLPVINNVQGDTWKAVEEYGAGINWDGLSVPDLHNEDKRQKAREFFENCLREDVFKNKVWKILEDADLCQKSENRHERKSNYGIEEIIKNGMALLMNKVQFPSARFIRYPVIVRGKRYIEWGKNLTAGYHCRFEVNGNHEGKVLIFGENVNVGDYVSIRCAERVSIGDNVLMGSRVLITDNTHGKYSGENQDAPDTFPDRRKLQTAPVKIGDNVWIGEGAVIQMGVTVGVGSIIAANSVVTKNIKPGVIAGGVPAKVLKQWKQECTEWVSAGYDYDRII